MPVHVRSFTLVGTEAVPVDIEIDLLRRLPAVVIVGLSNSAVRESADRVRHAILASGFEFPRARVVVSIAPADLRKGNPTALDLPIAVGILVASGQVPPEVLDAAWMGELSLNGEVRDVRGALATARAAKAAGMSLVVPHLTPMAALAGGGVQGIAALHEIRDYDKLPRLRTPAAPPTATPQARRAPDYSDITGLDPSAIDGLCLAAQTGRPLLLRSAPGIGRMMIAARFGGLLGPMSKDEALDVATIYDAMGFFPSDPSLPTDRPFRAPHHTISTAGLLGNAEARPGEATLAHRGVLCLEDFPEFPRSSWEALRGPMQDGKIRRPIGGTRFTDLPARFHLVACANYCPCGAMGSTRRCMCTQEAIERYEARLNVPLLRDAVVVELRKDSDTPWPSTRTLCRRTGASPQSKPSLSALIQNARR